MSNNNWTDITDNWGAWIRVDTRPGTDHDNPELFVVTIQDETTAAVTLTATQAIELMDSLSDALWHGR